MDSIRQASLVLICPLFVRLGAEREGRNTFQANPAPHMSALCQSRR